MRCAGIERIAQMQLEEAALLFDNQDGIEAVGELPGEFLIEREGHPELRDANAEFFEFSLADGKIAQRLREIVISLACTDQAEPRALFLAVPPIDLVQPGELEDRIESPGVHLIFERQR